jgi:hypothetical protein
MLMQPGSAVNPFGANGHTQATPYVRRPYRSVGLRLTSGRLQARPPADVERLVPNVAPQEVPTGAPEWERVFRSRRAAHNTRKGGPIDAASSDFP